MSALASAAAVTDHTLHGEKGVKTAEIHSLSDPEAQRPTASRWQDRAPWGAPGQNPCLFQLLREGQ